MTKARDLANASTALSAVSATELAFVDGVTSAIQTQLDAKALPANVINNTFVDAKGDLISATANDTPARLAVGNNGETLVADSSTSTGLRWQGDYAAGKNKIINGDFGIWQRGTSMASGTTTFCADRWGNFRGVSGSTFSRQVTNDTTNLPNIQYCVRGQRDSGNTNTTTIYLLQDFESVNSIPFVGKTVTLSFYARAGANYSAASNALLTNLYTGTGTDQSLRSGFTGGATPISQTTILTTTWQRFIYTGTIATTATQIALRFDFGPTGTAGANDYFEMTGVQLEVGSVATPFSRAAGTIQGELAACQRYYYLHLTSAASGKAVGMGYYQSATQVRVYVSYPVTMRTSPSLVAASGTNYYQVVVNGSADGFNSFTINAAGESGTEIYNGSEVSGTVGQAAVCEATNASSSIAFSAEL